MQQNIQPQEQQNNINKNKNKNKNKRLLQNNKKDNKKILIIKQITNKQQHQQLLLEQQRQEEISGQQQQQQYNYFETPSILKFCTSKQDFFSIKNKNLTHKYKNKRRKGEVNNQNDYYQSNSNNNSNINSNGSNISNNQNRRNCSLNIIKRNLSATKNSFYNQKNINQFSVLSPFNKQKASINNGKQKNMIQKNQNQNQSNSHNHNLSLNLKSPIYFDFKKNYNQNLNLNMNVNMNIKNTMTTTDDDHLILQFSKKKVLKKNIPNTNNSHLSFINGNDQKDHNNNSNISNHSSNNSNNNNNSNHIKNNQNNRIDKPRLSQPIKMKRSMIHTTDKFLNLSTSPKAHKLTINNFKLIQKLGQGTYSQVYKAIHIKTNTIYALKVLSKLRMKSLKVQQNIFRQIKLQQFLNHANLVQLYGYFHDQENVYLICQYCTDGNCYSKLNKYKAKKNRNGFTNLETSKIIKQLCQGVNHMHKNNIMHRDIKPQNLLITMGGTVKLGDFGWAIYNPTNQLRKTICGTPLYLAPQLISQVSYTQAVDVWAIGILTYQFLTGQNPFNIRDIRQLSKIVQDQVDYQLIKDQDDGARDFIMQILNKDSKKRSTVDVLLQHQFLSKVRLSKNHL